MAWRFKKVEEQRRELIEAYLKRNENMTELCERFDVSRKTAYKWCKRYKSLGEQGLKDQSKAPHNPRHSYSRETIEMALKFKYQKRKWGPKKIIERLRREYPRIDWPSPTRLYEIFKEHNLVQPKRIRSRVPATHPLGELNGCNDVWIVDFKGWFLTQDGNKCEPLTITDGHSRFLIKCQHLPSKTVDSVWPVFMEAFQEFGLPKRIRTDNGTPFGCLGVGRLTKLSVNLIKAGVVPEWINPGHPEENGRHERFHLTLKKAIADPSAKTFSQQIKQMRAFEEEYNFERPHEALNMKTPGECYYKSNNKWDGILRSPLYDTDEMIVRKVGQNGCIWIKQVESYIGQTLAGEYIGMKENEQGEKEVFYGPIYLGKLKAGRNRIEKPVAKRKKVVRR
jgi:transposase InsO family protein